MAERVLPRRWLPQSLIGRLALVLVVAMLMSQVAAQMIWSSQLRARAESATTEAAQQLGHAAAGAIRYFRSLPPNYRVLVLQQFREMGGTRFFVAQNPASVEVVPLRDEPLADLARESAERALRDDVPQLNPLSLAFVQPEHLAVEPGGPVLTELPPAWVQHLLLPGPDAAPLLVIQTELEPGNWLYLAALMPDPLFLKNSRVPGTTPWLLQGLALTLVLLLALWVVMRWITRPLAALSEAAEAIGRDEPVPPLPDSGSSEFLSTARAFSTMRERIQRYLDERERLFTAISHDLRTPITRLKLRAELLDDDQLRKEFEEDLDDLDMMVKGALQRVKDSQIHENLGEVRVDPLLERLVRGARLAGHVVAFEPAGLSVRAKPLALKRALGNLLDNALFYGEQARLSSAVKEGWVEIQVRDRGPGVPEDALQTLFEPRVRLGHGRARNGSGQGLGLGIARGIVESLGGELRLSNVAEGGLLAVVRLPAFEEDDPHD